MYASLDLSLLPPSAAEKQCTLRRDLLSETYELHYFEIFELSGYREDLFAATALYKRKAKRVELFCDTYPLKGVVGKSFVVTFLSYLNSTTLEANRYSRGKSVR
jgi:hypothetical protein